MDRIGGVEAEAVEVEFIDPVTAVGDVNSRTGVEFGPSKLIESPQSVSCSRMR